MRYLTVNTWILIAAIVVAGFGFGCNGAQTGALLGSAIGAAAGAGIDHDQRGRGALIGAGIGAVGGYIFGNEADKSPDGSWWPQTRSHGGEGHRYAPASAEVHYSYQRGYHHPRCNVY
ncbi:MAG: hypothetical protein CMJ18_17105 [Phycisphaeraceae bacterium]|nr:hypothetical protein [Phycisphaeraceae bacterium]